MKTNQTHKNYSKNQREYQLVMPLDLEEIIPEDDSVRLSQILDELDYGELNRAYSAMGRKPATPPRVMFKVIVYGPHCGVFSSRKLESACRWDVNFRWLLLSAAAAQQVIADIDKQQYGAMLKGENTDEHDKLRIKHEAELKQLQTAYAQAMGIGYKKPKNQLLPDAQSAKDSRHVPPDYLSLGRTYRSPSPQ